MGLISSPFKALTSKWSQYKYRFLPWVAMNLPSGQISAIQQDFLIYPDEKYIQDLAELFQEFECPKYELLFRDNPARREHFQSLHATNAAVIQENWGFSLGIGDSLIPGAGRGVFLSQGSIRAGQLVALYPGCVYQPSQPILLQSLGNPYILR